MVLNKRSLLPTYFSRTTKDHVFTSKAGKQVQYVALCSTLEPAREKGLRKDALEVHSNQLRKL